jgi:iron complex transport system permease protein
VFAIVSLGAHYQASLLFLYLLGSNANHTWNDVRLVAPWLAVGLPLALLAARPLNLLRLGDDVAAGLGLSVQRTRLLLLLLAAALAAPVVAVSGPIAWVALVSPHLARRLCGRADARLVLPLAMLIGAVTLVVADQMGRLIFAPQEVPAGAWTTALAGPALLVMLRRGDSEAAS